MTALPFSHRCLALLLVATLLLSSCGFGAAADPTPTPPPAGEREKGADALPTSLPQPTPTTAAAGTTSAGQSPTPTALPPVAGSGRVATLSVAPTALNALPDFAPPPGQPASFEDVIARGSRLQPLFAELATTIDRSQFDLDELNAALAFDAPTLVNFVRNQIAFEQYSGVLRGPRGTLIGRAGSALDQALLLRRLLDDAGYETRLARANLSRPQAEALLNQMAAPRPAAPPPGQEADMLRVLGQIAAEGAGVSAPPDLAPPNYYAQVLDLTEADSSLIFSALAEAEVSLVAHDPLAALLAEAQDYFWVQYRLSSFDDWQAAHPAFVDADAAPANLAPEITYREGPPDELYHRFRFEVSIEQKFDEELRVYPIVVDREWVVADLVGRPLTFQNQPNNLDLETAVTLDELLTGTGVFLPLVNGELAENAFDLDGRAFGAGLVSLDTVGMTELFQSAAGGAETAAGLIGGLGEEDPDNPDDLLTLTALWLDFTLVAPDGTETPSRRTVLDRVGPANRAAGLAEITADIPLSQAARALLTTYTILLLPGEYGRAYIANRAVNRTLTELELLADISPDGALQAFPDDAITALVPPQDVLLSAAFGNGLPPASQPLRSYRPAPALVVYEQGLLPGSGDTTAYERVDVIHNPRRTFAVDNGQIRPDPAAAVRQGVWETFAERILLQGTGSEPQGALQAIRAAAAAGIPLRVIPPTDPAGLDALPHSPATLDTARRDLAAGYVVIIPEGPHDDSGLTGWWRIDPRTGETLGMSTGGFGQAYVEYLISLKFGALFALIGYNQCRAAGGSAGCCLYENLALLAIGFTAGYWIGQIAVAAGAAASTSFGISFLLGDVGLGTAGLFNPVSICT